MSIDRRTFLGAAAGALLGSRPGYGAARKPNVIVILADDLGYADVGFNGARDTRTPNIDSIARGGVRFTNGYVSHPFCSPTRAGLMTGRYQQRFGHENNPVYDPKDATAGLPLTESTVAQAMSDAGYATGQIGKWHLGAIPAMHPLRRGFREQFGFIGGGHDYFKQEMQGSPREYFIPIERDGKPVEEKEYLTTAFGREAAAFVRRHARDPFFLYLAFNSPHTPQQAPEKYQDRYRNIADEKRRLNAAMTTAMDDAIGEVLAAVRESKLDNDTLIFFFSDNGGPISVNGSHNDPLRGAKGQVYEGGIRVPFAMRWTGRLPAGAEFHHPVISLDVFPTAAALAGAKLPAKKLDGVDLMPHILGKVKQPPHETLFWRTNNGASFAVRQGRYKLVRVGTEAPKLYDLEADIGEKTDLAASKPDVLKKLDAARERWNGELIPPVFQSPRPQAKKGKG